MNTPFDDDTSEVEEAPREDSEQEGGQPSEDHSNDVPPQPTMCQAAVTSWKPVEEGLTPPNARMRSAVTLLDGEIMERWSQFLKKVCVDSSASVFPVSPPGQKGQLLYPIQVNSIPVVALLDHGASHCFMAREWAIEKQLPMEPLARPGTFTFFNGTHDSITHLVRCSSVQIGSHRRPWTFLVVSATPMPVVLGLDAIRGWPLFYSPLDDRLFILEWTSHRHEARQPVTSLHAGKIATKRDVNNSALPSHPALECSSLFPQHPSDLPCSPLPSPTSPLGHEDSLPPPVAKGTKDRPPSRSLIQDDHPLHSPHTDSCTGNVAVVAENVIDFLNVARSPWKVEWFGEAEDEGAVRLMTVTASGDEEAKQLQDFLTSLDPRLKAVVDRYPHLFAPPDPLPPERSVKHHIHLPIDVVPVSAPAYPLGLIKCTAMRTQMRELIDKGWVVPSESPWASPILLVPKDEGKKLRMCIDYRNLNALTKKDSFPLPRLDVMLHKSAGATIFSKLDLASGFHQIAVHPPHAELTSFILPEAIDGHALWQWRVMPFGLVNAPPTFQRAMTVALRGCEEFAAVYIDDILIYSPTIDEHLHHLAQVFQKLQDQAYHVRLAKYQFMSTEVHFLGHKLTIEGIEPVIKESKDLSGFRPPFTKSKQVRSFLGLVMWYKAFIPHVSTIAAPLFPLTSEKRKFEWTEHATLAVEALKKAILEAPVLAKFDRDLPTRVTTDASTVGIGAVFEQRHTQGWRPVAFWSRKLKDAETRYSATDIEWLAVVDAVTLIWRYMLEDIPFLIRSDHKALERKLMKSAHDPPLLPRHTRWIERLMPYAYNFEYIKGTDNLVADALSRCPYMLNTVTVVHSMLAGLLARMQTAAAQDPLYQQEILAIRAARMRAMTPPETATENDTSTTEPPLVPESTPALAETTRTVPGPATAAPLGVTVPPTPSSATTGATPSLDTAPPLAIEGNDRSGPDPESTAMSAKPDPGLSSQRMAYLEVQQTGQNRTRRSDRVPEWGDHGSPRQ